MEVPVSYQTWRCWRALPIAVTLAVALTLCFGNDRAIADPNHEADTANWIALPLSGIDGFFPTPGVAAEPHLRHNPFYSFTETGTAPIQTILARIGGIASSASINNSC